MNEHEDLVAAELRKIEQHLKTISGSPLITNPVWTIVKAWLAVSLIALVIAGLARSCAG